MTCARRFLGVLAAMLFGASAWAEQPASADQARAEARRAAAAELADLAPRIESLKREVAAGRSRGAELERLLARAQELASVLDRLERGQGALPALRPAGPDSQELRERADALRDRADRMAAVLAEVDRRLVEARRRAELEERLGAVTAPGDLFAEFAPRRRSGAPPSTPATAGPAGSSAAPTVAVVPLSSSPPVTAPARSAEGLAPAASDSVPILQRKQAEIAAIVSALRVQAEALEAEAKAVEAIR